MAALAVLGALFGVLFVVAYLLTDNSDHRGVLGLLLLTLTGLFLKHRWLSNYFKESQCSELCVWKFDFVNRRKCE
jgi:hypothetical protein